MPHPAAFLAALALAMPLAAQAADFGYPDEPLPPPRRFAPPPPDWAPPPPRPVVRAPDVTCRVFVRRRAGPFGEDELRRVRVCDEGPAYGPSRWAHREPPFREHRRPPLEPADEPEE